MGDLPLHMLLECVTYNDFVSTCCKSTRFVETISTTNIQRRGLNPTFEQYVSNVPVHTLFLSELHSLYELAIGQCLSIKDLP